MKSDKCVSKSDNAKRYALNEDCIKALAKIRDKTIVWRNSEATELLQDIHMIAKRALEAEESTTVGDACFPSPQEREAHLAAVSRTVYEDGDVSKELVRAADDYIAKHGKAGLAETAAFISGACWGAGAAKDARPATREADHLHEWHRLPEGVFCKWCPATLGQTWDAKAKTWVPAESAQHVDAKGDKNGS